MKVILKKRKGIDVFDVIIDGNKSLWSVSKDSFLSSIYFLVYRGKRLKKRLSSMDEVRQFLTAELLSESAEQILKGNK